MIKPFVAVVGSGGIGSFGAAAPPIGSLATIGKTSARVVRHFATGIALEFDEALPVDTFGVDTKL